MIAKSKRLFHTFFLLKLGVNGVALLTFCMNHVVPVELLTPGATREITETDVNNVEQPD